MFLLLFLFFARLGHTQDSCTNAIALTCGETNVFPISQNTLTTQGCDPPSPLGAWFAVQNAVSDDALLAWTIQATGIQTPIVVAHTLGCDDACFRTETSNLFREVTMNVTTQGSRPQYLFVSQSPGTDMLVEMQVECGPLPRNCANLLDIDCSGTGLTLVEGRTTLSVGAGHPCDSSGGTPVLYSVRSAVSAKISVTTDHPSTEGDTVLNVYGNLSNGGSQCHLDNMVPSCVATNDDGEETFASFSSDLTFWANEGESYLIGVTGYGGNSDAYTMVVSCSDGLNTTCADTMQCTDGASIAFTGRTLTSASEPSRVNACGAPGGDAVWYRISSGDSRTVELSTDNEYTTADTVLTVYPAGDTACALQEQSTCLAWSTADKVTFFAEAGLEYVVGVSHRAQVADWFALRVNCGYAAETFRFVSTTPRPTPSNTIAKGAPGGEDSGGGSNGDAGDFIESLFTEPLFEGDGTVFLSMGYRELTVLGATAYCLLFCLCMVAAARRRRRDDPVPIYLEELPSSAARMTGPVALQEMSSTTTSASFRTEPVYLEDMSTTSSRTSFTVRPTFSPPQQHASSTRTSYNMEAPPYVQGDHPSSSRSSYAQAPPAPTDHHSSWSTRTTEPLAVHDVYAAAPARGATLTSFCTALKALSNAGLIRDEERRELLLGACQRDRRFAALASLSVALSYREDDAAVVQRLRTALLDVDEEGNVIVQTG